MITRLVEGECATRDKGLRWKHRTHCRPYSIPVMFLPTGNVPLSAMVVGDNQGAKISTPTEAEPVTLILSYRIPALQINTCCGSAEFILSNS